MNKVEVKLRCGRVSNSVLLIYVFGRVPGGLQSEETYHREERDLLHKLVTSGCTQRPSGGYPPLESTNILTVSSGVLECRYA